MAARRVCDWAEKDLMAIKYFRTKLPGDFNIAASTVCGGYYQHAFISTRAWQSENDPQDDHVAAYVGFSDAQAKRIFQAAIAFKAPTNVYEEALKGGIYVVKSEIKAYQIFEIERATLKFISEVAIIKDHEDVAGRIKPLGVLKVKAWEGPGLDPEDISDDEEAEKAFEEPPVESFWLEDDILRLMHAGLKLELVVHELNIGVKFFDQIIGLYCSFHTYLENEKLNGWKEPGKLSLSDAKIKLMQHSSQ